MNQATKTEAEKYIQEHIPTMVGEHHVSSMELTTLISLLNGYASQSKWVSVDEPPEKHCSVLVHDPNNPFDDYKAIARYNEYNSTFFINGSDVIHPTHWQPLPKPPVEKS